MVDKGPVPGNLRVILSFAVAMILRIIPLRGDWVSFNPDWVGLVLLFWVLAVPPRVGVLRAWGIGLIVDALTGCLLGQHALAYGVMAYLGFRVKASLTVLRKPIQAGWILGLLLVGQLLILWTQHREIPKGMELAYWYPSLIGGMFWPLLGFILDTKDSRGMP